MRRFASLVVAALAIPAGDGCNSCSGSIEHGLTIEVFNAKTKTKLCGADFLVTDGDFRAEEKEACVFTTAVERKGTYRIEVRRPNFKTTVLEGIEVTGDSCHVDNRRIEVFVEPTEGDGECRGVCGSSPLCGTCPPRSVVPTGTFEIDSSEVTAAAYRGFLRANLSLKEQSVDCVKNDFTIEPGRVHESVTSVLVDWCDALAYCAWSGQQLCSAPQWESACTAAPAGAIDLAGGNPEWTQACELNSCAARGGSTCGTVEWRARNGAAAFRCCSR